MSVLKVFQKKKNKRSLQNISDCFHGSQNVTKY